MALVITGLYWRRIATTYSVRYHQGEYEWKYGGYINNSDEWYAYMNILYGRFDDYHRVVEYQKIPCIVCA